VGVRPSRGLGAARLVLPGAFHAAALPPSATGIFPFPTPIPPQPLTPGTGSRSPPTQPRPHPAPGERCGMNRRQNEPAPSWVSIYWVAVAAWSPAPGSAAGRGSGVPRCPRGRGEGCPGTIWRWGCPGRAAAGSWWRSFGRGAGGTCRRCRRRRRRRRSTRRGGR